MLMLMLMLMLVLRIHVFLTMIPDLKMAMKRTLSNINFVAYQDNVQCTCFTMS